MEKETEREKKRIVTIASSSSSSNMYLNTYDIHKLGLFDK
jgi:hypothetical protein